MHLITAECACRHNYRAVGKLGNKINLKIYNYSIVDLEDLDYCCATIPSDWHKYLLVYVTMPEYENSQSYVYVGTQCYAISKVNKHKKGTYLHTLALYR